MSGEITELTNENFNKEVLNKKGFTLVDFWAPWCGPCRMMASVIDELSLKHKNITFGKVNVDDNQEISSNYRVSSIPCFILFKDGEAIASRVGGCSLEEFDSWIKEHTK